MPFTEEEKEFLAQAISYYCLNYVWGELRDKDANAAAEEFFKLKTFCKNCGIWDLLSEEVHRGN